MIDNIRSAEMYFRLETQMQTKNIFQAILDAQNDPHNCSRSVSYQFYTYAKEKKAMKGHF